jgi:Aldehyde oxidase and xanthine dehydrogenase, a/b hammerhead domain
VVETILRANSNNLPKAMRQGRHRSRRIITAKDVPHNVYTILSLINFGPEDEPVLAFDKVRWLGEPVVAVIADSERSAQQGAALVRVDYEELPAVFDVEDALKPGAPLVNEYHGQNYIVMTAVRAARSSSAMPRRVFARPITSWRSDTIQAPSSTLRPRPPAASWCPIRTIDCFATPAPRRFSSRSTTPRSFSACRRNGCISSAVRPVLYGNSAVPAR